MGHLLQGAHLAGSLRTLVRDRFAPIPGVAEMLPPIGEALGFHGALTIDMIVDERSGAPVRHRGERPTGRHHEPRATCGGGLRFGACGRCCSACRAAPTRGAPGVTVTAGLYPQDLVRCIEEGEFAPLRDWLAVATLADLPWTDPGVFLSNTRFLLSHLVRRN